MDNNKLVIGIIVAVAAFLGAPIAMRALRPAAVPVAATAPAAPATAPNPYPAAQPPAYTPAQPQVQQQQQAQQPQAAPQGLTAQTLVGTLWEVRAVQGTVQFQFGPGGQGTVIHPMAGQIPATWSCSGNQVNASATAYGQSLTLSAIIQGNNLVAQNCSIHRLQ